MSLSRLRNIVHLAVPTLFRQISGGRVRCESEATLQLHLGRIISSAADLEIISERETFSVELEKPLRSNGGKRGRIDVWFRLTDGDGREWRCAIELKFFKRENHREPNNRYDVFKDIAPVIELGSTPTALSNARPANGPGCRRRISAPACTVTINSCGS